MKERKNLQGHGSAHSEEEIKGGTALWGQRDIEKEREEERERGRVSLAVHWPS